MPHRTKGPGVLGAVGPGDTGPFGRWPEPDQDSEPDTDTYDVLGRYSFTASVPAGGSLRPLRDPDAPGLDDEDGDGAED
jgi:hypothetical protein